MSDEREELERVLVALALGLPGAAWDHAVPLVRAEIATLLKEACDKGLRAIELGDAIAAQENPTENQGKLSDLHRELRELRRLADGEKGR